MLKNIVRDLLVGLLIGTLLSIFLSINFLIVSYETKTKQTINAPESVRLTVPDDFFSLSKWEKLVKKIQSNSTKVVILDWKGYGGLERVGLIFIERLKIAQKLQTIKFDIEGPSISMHALVLCHADNVKFASPNAVMIFHPVFYKDDYGKKVYAMETMPLFDPCIKKGYLTKADVKNMYYNKQRIEVYKDIKKICKPDWKSCKIEAR